MIFFCLFITILMYNADASNSCVSRSIKGQSVVCVCNSTYCDQVKRMQPKSGSYVAYTSSKAGLRFQTTTGPIQPSNMTDKCCSVTLVIDPKQKFQIIEGFGGAVTDAAGINWKTLSSPLQQYLIDSYFSENGLEYNMIRVPIGGSDFSTHAYTYNELPVNDTKLSNFSLSSEDYLYKIPMIKACVTAANRPIHIIATTWSPPVWMKTNGDIGGSSRLKEEYYETYADYHLKFLEKYADEGISIWGITTTNEPINGIIPIVHFNSLGWMPESMARWIIENLGPKIRNSTFRKTKILALDDQRYMIPLFFDIMVAKNASVLNYIDGLAVHYYGDYITPASVLSSFVQKHPDKFIIATEACEGSFPWEFQKVILGSWTRAEHYIKDILQVLDAIVISNVEWRRDLNHAVSGWIDWNLCLSHGGGPNWVKNFVDSPIIVTSKDEFVKQPMFYAMGHFSKFIPRGSQRISVENNSWNSKVSQAAFITPENTIVIVIYNGGSKRKVKIAIGQQAIVIQMDPSSVTTMEMIIDDEHKPQISIHRV